jgi:hypothetical protein
MLSGYPDSHPAFAGPLLGNAGSVESAGLEDILGHSVSPPAKVIMIPRIVWSSGVTIIRVF